MIGLKKPQNVSTNILSSIDSSIVRQRSFSDGRGIASSDNQEESIFACHSTVKMKLCVRRSASESSWANRETYTTVWPEGPKAKAAQNVASDGPYCVLIQLRAELHLLGVTLWTLGELFFWLIFESLTDSIGSCCWATIHRDIAYHGFCSAEVPVAYSRWIIFALVW